MKTTRGIAMLVVAGVLAAGAFAPSRAAAQTVERDISEFLESAGNV